MPQLKPRFAAPMPPGATDAVAHFGRQTAPADTADALRAANKRRLFDSLTAMGITYVTVTFEGCGEKSRINGIAAWSGETSVDFPETEIAMAVLTRNRIGVEMRRLSLAEGVEFLAHDLLSALHSDGENSVETHGTFCFDAAADTIHVETHVVDAGQAGPAAASRSLPPSDLSALWPT